MIVAEHSNMCMLDLHKYYRYQYTKLTKSNRPRDTADNEYLTLQSPGVCTELLDSM